MTNARNLSTYGTVIPKIIPEYRTSNTQLTSTDNGKLIILNSSSPVTQTIAAVASLGTNWSLYFFNSGTATVTIDPNSSETINSSSTLSVSSNTFYNIYSTGSAFKAVKLYAPVSTSISGTGVLTTSENTSTISVDFANATGPTILGRNEASSGAVSALSTQLLSLITAADAASARAYLSVDNITNAKVQNVNAAATTAIDLNNGHVINLSHGADINTLTFSNVPTVCEILIIRTKDNSESVRSITWPSSVLWENAPPSLGQIANAFNIIRFTTFTSGDKWLGKHTYNVGGYRFYNWGYNNNALGLGYTIDRSNPTLVTNSTDWKQISNNNVFGLGIKIDNTLWGWGGNTYGYLGTSDVNVRSTPVQIGNLNNWKSVAVGASFAIAIKTDGTLWSWGRNDYGELGQGDLAYRSSPTQVGSLATWSKVSCGQYHSVAIKTDGTLWGWGNNTNCQLGYNGNSVSVPTQVGTDTNWSYVSCGTNFTMVIKTTGALYAGGYNYSGQLGFGTYNNTVYSLTQLGANTWSKVHCSNDTNGIIAIRSDGTLWTCGYNGTGELGVGDRNDRSSPVQVGNLTDWAQAVMGSGVHAIKTDGTLWSWGNYGNGANGLGTNTSYSSPMQVGSLTTWKYMFPMHAALASH